MLHKNIVRVTQTLFKNKQDAVCLRPQESVAVIPWLLRCSGLYPPDDSALKIVTALEEEWSTYEQQDATELGSIPPSYCRPGGMFKYRSGDRLLLQGFRGFPQSHHANSGIVSQIRPRPLPSHILSSLLFTNTPGMRCFIYIFNVVKYAVNQWFPNWSIPSPGGRWDYLVGRWRWAFPIALFPYLRLK